MERTRILSKGFELKKARIKAGLYQFEMAKKVKISRQQYAELEAGRKGCRPQIAQRICHVLGCSFDDIFCISIPEERK